MRYLILCGTLLFLIGLISHDLKTMIGGAAVAGAGFAIMIVFSLLDDRGNGRGTE